MLNNQNAFQNAGQHGFFYYQSVGNQRSNLLLMVITFILLGALLKSEERFRKLVVVTKQI